MRRKAESQKRGDVPLHHRKASAAKGRPTRKPHTPINNNLINLTNTMEKNKKQFAQFVIQALIAVLTALAGVFTGCKMVG